MPPIAGSTGHTTSSPHSASHKRKAIYTNSETRTRSHARDPSQTSMDCGRSTPRKLDVHKDLPGIPSQTTGLRGLEPVMGALPRHKRRPLKVEAASHAATSKASSSAEPRLDTTTSSWVPGEWMKQVSDDHSSEDRPSTDGSSEVSSSLPPAPTTRRFFAREIRIAPDSLEGKKGRKRVNQDGSFQCPRRGCHDVLPTPKALACHVHVHLLHDVSTSCELCGTLFNDEDDKEEHLNSCLKLPAFHEIESFNVEQPVGPLDKLLGRLHL